MRQQNSLMKFDPATATPHPYPSHAQQYRDWHGSTAWLYNPWTGDKRDPRDIGSDILGHLILPPGEPLYADTLSPRSGGQIGAQMAQSSERKITGGLSHN